MVASAHYDVFRYASSGRTSLAAILDSLEPASVDADLIPAKGEVSLPFGWFFLMTHGHWVDPDVGLAIADGLKTQRDPDAAVLLRWAERTYGF